MTLHFNHHPHDNRSIWSSVPVVSRWLWPGNRTFLDVASMVVTWWIVAFLHSAYCQYSSHSHQLIWQAQYKWQYEKNHSKLIHSLSFVMGLNASVFVERIKNQIERLVKNTVWNYSLHTSFANSFWGSLTIVDSLTLKVLNFWKFTSYCSLKPLWSAWGK